MSHEGLSMYGEQTMPTVELAQREQFYQPVSLDVDPIFCGDERASDAERYIHVFGGGLNIAYTLDVMKETYQPGSADGSFEDSATSITPLLQEVARVQAGVHSDDHAEHSSVFNLEIEDGEVGCGYAAKRQAISGLIAERGEEIIQDAKTLRPELFLDPADQTFAEAVIGSHGRLATRDGYFAAGGRKVVLAAIKQGAPVMVVKGNHEATYGTINLVPDTSFHSTDAVSAGLPTYDHDAWATREIYDRIQALYPYDRRQLEIAETIDAIGTMRALGVETIDVRRGELATQ